MRSILLTLMAISFTAWFIGTVAALLFFVSVMTVVTVSSILFGSLVMFGFGAHAAGRTARTRLVKAQHPATNKLVPANFATSSVRA